MTRTGQGKSISLSQSILPIVIRIQVSRILILALLLLLTTSSLASAYGRSVEDLVGAFSIEKTIKIGSSSQDFTTAGESLDPLSPPQSMASGPLADDQAPSLAGFAFEPQKVSANSTPSINLTLHAIDDQAVWAAEARFSGPAGEEATALFPAQNLTSGSAKDGVYSARMLLPANGTGDWLLQSLILVDREGNRRTLGQSELRQLGLPTQISVV